MEAKEVETNEETPMKIEDEEHQSGMPESEFGHGHITENDVTDEDTSDTDSKSSSNKKKSDDH